MVFIALPYFDRAAFGTWLEEAFWQINWLLLSVPEKTNRQYLCKLLTASYGCDADEQSDQRWNAHYSVAWSSSSFCPFRGIIFFFVFIFIFGRIKVIRKVDLRRRESLKNTFMFKLQIGAKSSTCFQNFKNLWNFSPVCRSGCGSR